VTGHNSEQVGLSHWKDKAPCIGLLRQNCYCLWEEVQSYGPSLGANGWGLALL